MERVTALPGPTDTESSTGPSSPTPSWVPATTKLGVSDNKDDPAQVAEQGFEGLMKGEASVFAGSLSSRAMGRLSGVSPDSLATKVKAPMEEPGSAEG